MSKSNVWHRRLVRHGLAALAAASTVLVAVTNEATTLPPSTEAAPTTTDPTATDPTTTTDPTATDPTTTTTTATTMPPTANSVPQADILTLSVSTECRGRDAYFVVSVTANADVADVTVYAGFTRPVADVWHVSPPQPLEVVGSMAAGETATSEHLEFSGVAVAVTAAASSGDSAGPASVVIPVCGDSAVVATPTAGGATGTLPDTR